MAGEKTKRFDPQISQITQIFGVEEYPNRHKPTTGDNMARQNHTGRIATTNRTDPPPLPACAVNGKSSYFASPPLSPCRSGLIRVYSRDSRAIIPDLKTDGSEELAR